MCSGQIGRRFLESDRVFCVQDLTAGQMANLVWALGRASYASPRTNALLSVVCSHAVDVITEFGPEELTRLLHSLSVLSYHNKTLFEEAEVVILERLDDFDFQSLAMLATAFVSHLDKPAASPAPSHSSILQSLLPSAIA